MSIMLTWEVVLLYVPYDPNRRSTFLTDAFSNTADSNLA